MSILLMLFALLLPTLFVHLCGRGGVGFYCACDVLSTSPLLPGPSRARGTCLAATGSARRKRRRKRERGGGRRDRGFKDVVLRDVVLRTRGTFNGGLKAETLPRS